MLKTTTHSDLERLRLEAIKSIEDALRDLLAKDDGPAWMAENKLSIHRAEFDVSIRQDILDGSIGKRKLSKASLYSSDPKKKVEVSFPDSETAGHYKRTIGWQDRVAARMVWCAKAAIESATRRAVAFRQARALSDAFENLLEREKLNIYARDEDGELFVDPGLGLEPTPTFTSRCLQLGERRVYVGIEAGLYWIGRGDPGEGLSGLSEDQFLTILAVLRS